jgi:hypothetical protein
VRERERERERETNHPLVILVRDAHPGLDFFEQLSIVLHEVDGLAALQLLELLTTMRHTALTTRTATRCWRTVAFVPYYNSARTGCW